MQDMSNQYMFRGYQPQYSPSVPNGNLNKASPTFNSASYITPGSMESSSNSISSAPSSSGSSYSYHTPRLRYYLLKSFDIEDDMEFCPEISELSSSSPPIKRFNPYTATVFSPTSQVDGGSGLGADPSTPMGNLPQSPRTHTPRIKKPLEIINPQTKMRVGSPITASHK